MYIRRKVFSLLQDETGEERYFSTTEFELENGLDERYYSDDEEDSKGRELKGSGRGYGRAYLVGGLPQVIGVAAGAKKASKVAAEGGSDLDIIEASVKRAKNVDRGINTALVGGTAAGLGYVTHKGIKEALKNPSAKRVLVEKLGKDGAKKLIKRAPGAVALGTAALAAPAIYMSGKAAEGAGMKNAVARLRKTEKANKKED